MPGSGQHIVTQANGGLQGVVVGGPDGVGEDEGGNLMWLVDFKLDFFNDIEKTSEKGKFNHEKKHYSKNLEIVGVV